MTEREVVYAAGPRMRSPCPQAYARGALDDTLHVGPKLACHLSPDGQQDDVSSRGGRDDGIAT